MGNATEREEGHHHPNYVGIWALLVVLLVVGIAAGFVGHMVLSTILVLSVAAIKASLVAANYMHLKSEPRFVQVIVLACYSQDVGDQRNAYYGTTLLLSGLPPALFGGLLVWLYRTSRRCRPTPLDDPDGGPARQAE